MTDSMLLPDGSAVTLGDQLLIGRSESCGLRLTEPSVSREHALIRRVGNRWYVEDLGSRNGTLVNDDRVAPGARRPLRHGDRLVLGQLALVLSLASEAADPDRTSSLELALGRHNPLSAYQLQVVRRLAAPWLAGAEQPASNATIAADLGTPLALDAVKAALRRAYAKAGLADAPAATKRRSLCRVARERGWL